MASRGMKFKEITIDTLEDYGITGALITLVKGIGKI
jgi:hypothetical protein